LGQETEQIRSIGANPFISRMATEQRLCSRLVADENGANPFILP